MTHPPMSDPFPYDYVGGGYFRRKTTTVSIASGTGCVLRTPAPAKATSPDPTQRNRSCTVCRLMRFTTTMRGVLGRRSWT